MSHSARLAAAGLILPSVAAPVGSYVPALRYGDLVTTSGQVAVRRRRPPGHGHRGRRRWGHAGGRGRLRAHVRRSMPSPRPPTPRAASTTSPRWCKVIGYVASAPDFGGQPAVINGASDLMVEIFGEAGRHARSAVGVAALPLGAPVEIELDVADAVGQDSAN